MVAAVAPRFFGINQRSAMNSIESAPRKAPNLAPFSADVSSRLKFVAGYFSVSGGFALAGIGLSSVISIARGTASIPMLLLFAALGGAVAAGFFWTGRALRERRKAGWYAGLVTLGAPLVSALAGKSLGAWPVAVGVIGLGLLFSVRRELE